MDLPIIWAALIAFAVLAYITLDGFDLGVGILFAAEHDDADRDVMVNSVAPVWDGNETWLVLGGGGLFAVFPLAYATILPALYPAIIGMLLALVFRGVAFEFRFRAFTRTGRRLWDISFTWSTAPMRAVGGIGSPASPSCAVFRSLSVMHYWARLGLSGAPSALCRSVAAVTPRCWALPRWH